MNKWRKEREGDHCPRWPDETVCRELCTDCQYGGNAITAKDGMFSIRCKFTGGGQ